MKLKYFGHSSFELIMENTIIYIDPYVGIYTDKADVVLVTHEHYDHNQVDLVPLKMDAKIYRSDYFIHDDEYRGIKVNNIIIQSVPAYNSNHKREECVGYIIIYDNKKLYFAGDTSETDYMPKISKLNIDYVFLPIDGIYNMDGVEANKCAEIINAKYTVPIHVKPGSLFDDEIVNNFNCKNKLILHPNDEINI